MKKSSIITIIVGVVLVIASFAIVEFSGTNMLDSIKEFSQGDHRNFKIEEKTFTVDDISKIAVDSSNDQIKIMLNSDVDQIKVEYYSSDDAKFNINKTDTKLAIEKQDQRWVHWFNFDLTEKQIIVHVPIGVVFEYDLQTSNGQIELTDIGANRLDLKTSNGSIRLDKIKANDKITLKTSNATIDLNDVTSSSDVDATTSNGLVSLTGVKTNEVWAKNSNGLVAVTETVADKMWVKTSNGRIELNRLVSGDITLNTSNASISGSITGVAGDYSKDISTSNGDIIINDMEFGKRVRDDRGTKSLFIDTSNASVNITFQN